MHFRDLCDENDYFSNKKKQYKVIVMIGQHPVGFATGLKDLMTVMKQFYFYLYQ